jgi:hypothetical protein
VSRGSVAHAIQAWGGHAERRPSHWDVRVLVWLPCCSSLRCPQEPRYVASYAYVTGRRGRTTSRRLYYCEAHAARFANRHALVLPELPARARLTIAELDAELGTDNAGALEALGTFQCALKKAFGESER